MNPCTALTIDKSADMRRLNSMVISRKIKDCRVLEAATLAEGRALLGAEKPGLVILEADMPDGLGFDFCREAQAAGARVIFVTELDSSADLLRGFNAGGNYYIIKPFYDKWMLEALASRYLLCGGKPEAKPKNMKILIIDGSEMIRLTYREILEMDGYQTLTAGTLAEGRVLLETESPSALILDAALPDGSGFGFCGRLRAADIKIPILMTFTHGLKCDIDAGYAAGCDGYLLKPILSNEFLERIDALLRRGNDTG